MKKLMLLFSILITTLYSSSITIASGGITGNYYKIANELNKEAFKHKAKVINTAGSVENMLLVAKGKVDIAFVQADALDMLDIFYSNSNQTQDDLINIVNVICYII